MGAGRCVAGCFSCGYFSLVMLMNFSGEQPESDIAVVLPDGQFVICPPEQALNRRRRALLRRVANFFLHARDGVVIQREISRE